MQKYCQSVVINVIENIGETLATKEKNKEYQQLKQAQQAFLNNSSVQKAQEIFEFSFDKQSIKIL